MSGSLFYFDSTRAVLHGSYQVSTTLKTHSHRAPRAVVLDCETAPGVAYFWSLRDDHIPIDRIISNTRVLCVAWQVVGERKVDFAAEWQPGGRRRMLKRLSAAIRSADAIIGYNSARFDIPRINGELVAEGLPPLPNVAHIDLYTTVKRLGFDSGKLQHAAQKLEIGSKVAHSGWSLWRDVLAGSKPARRMMERYNVGDVRLTTKLFLRLRPHIKNLPALYPAGACQACGGTLRPDGERYTAKARIQRLTCSGCGSWSDGTRTPMKSPGRGHPGKAKRTRKCKG